MILIMIGYILSIYLVNLRLSLKLFHVLNLLTII